MFPSVDIRYAYKRSVATCIVEPAPVADYYQNEALEATWIPLSLEFMETFVEENIAFISSESSLAVSNPEMEWNRQPAECDYI